MNHPILNDSKVLKYFIGAGLIFILSDFMIFSFMNELSVLPTLINSIVYSMVLMVMGLVAWYPVVYVNNKNGYFSLFSQLFIVGDVLLMLWMLLSMSALFVLRGVLKLDYNIISEDLVLRFFYGGLIYFLFISVYYLFRYSIELQEQRQREIQLGALLQETKLNALKSQLNPHFLFNSLNSVSALTLSDPDMAREMVLKLSDFLRHSLKQSDDELLPLREELRNISRYLEIEKVRFGDKLQCEIEFKGDCKDIKVPAMILQPIYENAVKHGVYESIVPVTIRTYCELVENWMKITVINEFDPDNIPRKGEGLGLKNVKSRLSVLYKRDDLLSITKENNFFEASVLIPPFES